MEINFKQIGTIHTPYVDRAPYQPVNADEGEFYVEVFPEYREGLAYLGAFRYAYILYYVHELDRPVSMRVSPPWAHGIEVGLFASRSPLRPNPIGLSVVRVKGIHGTRVTTSGLDAFDGTPLLDLKPYIKDLDSKEDADYGWLSPDGDEEHLALHIRGIPHDY
ncbi:MAG: tRNA (N6-threonylcarbamoyladenosine(37)-N6)-methyltransferase TrmO [Promethearchaeota archaeon]